MNTYIIDIDDTLLIYPDSHLPPDKRGGAERYYRAKGNKEEIDICNKLYDEGHIIMIFTGRNWCQYELTKQQLNEFGIKYHQIIMGKPQGIHIDRDYLTSLKDIK